MVDLHGLVTLFLVCLIFTILFQVLFKSTHAKSRLPPNPFAFSILGHFHLLAPIPHQSFHMLSLRYGYVIHLYMGSVPCVVCSSEMAKEFLKTHGTVNLGQSKNSTTDYLTYGEKVFIFAHYKFYWKFMKKIVMSQLPNGTTLNLLLLVTQNEINHFIKSISQKARLGKSVDDERRLLHMTNNMISRMLFSERCSDEEEDAGEMRKLVSERAEIMGTFNLSDYIWLLKNLDLQGLGKKSKD